MLPTLDLCYQQFNSFNLSLPNIKPQKQHNEIFSVWVCSYFHEIIFDFDYVLSSCFIIKRYDVI